LIVKAVQVLGILLVSTPVFAQAPINLAGSPDGRARPAPGSQAVAPASEETMRMRYQLGVMERALEQAVQFGAQMTGRHMQQVAVSPSLWFSGPARARGFRLDGYGVFFDVEVPALRRSVMWSIRELNQPDLAITTAFNALKQHVATIADRPERSSLEQALQRLELQVGLPLEVPARGTGPMPAGGPGSVVPSDPGASYTSEVKKALIDAMLDHSGPIAIGPEEWLTIAARDNEERLTPADMYEVVTIVLRINGSDLAAFRADRLSREDARNTVEVKEF
jgi:hypothetical protein